MRSRRNLGMKQDKNHFLVILAIYFLIFLTMAVSPVFRGLHHECLEAILRKS